GGQRLTGMTAGQANFPLLGSYYDFAQYGKSGARVSSVFPHMAKVVDDHCIIRSLHADAMNHDPSMTFFQTCAPRGNRPSMGAWLSYGLGSKNQKLPAFCVLVSKGRGNGQGVYAKLWTNGFLDSVHQGVQFMGGPDPVLYLSDPPGTDRMSRRALFDKLAELNGL